MKKAVVVKYEIDHETMRVKRDIKVADAPKHSRDNLEFFYDKIGCNMIDVVYFDKFEAFVDDEGLLTSGNVVAEYTSEGFTVPLAGNLVFSAGIDAEGETVWFDNDEFDGIDAIMSVIDMVEKAELKGVTR